MIVKSVEDQTSSRWCGNLERKGPAWMSLDHSSKLRGVKVINLWLACHEFEISTTEDPPCIGGPMPVKSSEGQCSPVGVVKTGKRSSGVILITKAIV
ncbi:hypothetical protein TNCV_3344221 [Trichonephila clavipes]|nr:hypothetical protein TNCV_3344221 [Trichonephila clavipes]